MYSNSRNNLTQPMVNRLLYRHWGDSLIVPFVKDPQGGWGRMDYYVKLMLNEPCFSKATLPQTRKPPKWKENDS